MAALPALKVAVESHWLRVSVSGDASFSSSISFHVSSALTAPSVLMFLYVAPAICAQGRNWKVPSSFALALKLMP
ncbi:hypothetical protein D3C80_201020 [compost metagenome]